MGLSKEERINRGLEARRIVGHELFQEVLQTVKDAQVTRWEESTDEAVHRECWAVRRAISEVEDGLKAIINDGEVAASR